MTRDQLPEIGVVVSMELENKMNKSCVFSECNTPISFYFCFPRYISTQSKLFIALENSDFYRNDARQ